MILSDLITVDIVVSVTHPQSVPYYSFVRPSQIGAVVHGYINALELRCIRVLTHLLAAAQGYQGLFSLLIIAPLPTT